jgi:uncharacterized protein YdbL (DUF1318 family)
MASPARERRNHLAAALAIAAAFALLIAPAAHADALDAAKSAGFVGERRDGLLGLVKSDAPADVKALVQSVNAKRKDKYAAIAKKNGTTVAAVAALAGEKAIAKTNPGNYVQNAAGEWVTK